MIDVGVKFAMLIILVCLYHHHTPPPPPSPLLQPLSDEENDDVIVPLPPLPQQRNNNINLDFICCQCHAVEAGSYIIGAVPGLTSSVLATQPGYNYKSNVDLAFRVFIGLCICLNANGFNEALVEDLIKDVLMVRRVYDNGGN